MIGLYKDRRALGGEVSLPKISAPTSPRYEILSSILSLYKPGMVQGQKVLKEPSTGTAIKTNESQRRFSYSAIDQNKEFENNLFNVTHYTQTDDEELGTVKTPFVGNHIKSPQKQKKSTQPPKKTSHIEVDF